MESPGDLRAQGISTAIPTNIVQALGAWRDSADRDELIDEFTCARLDVALRYPLDIV